ncbi:MAG: hypothetical protein H6932_07130 [Burkholderiaceae bacterium]|nr:hypothetical protein [Burkholderiaceae bacterium]
MFHTLKHHAARAALFSAAFVASAALMAAIGALFHGASSRPVPSDAAWRHALAACEAARKARQHGICVAEHLARAEARRAATVTAMAKPPPEVPAEPPMGPR